MVTGELESDSKQAIIDYLGRRSLIPIRIDEKGKAKAGILSFSFDKITPQDRILLTRNLATSIKAGMSIVEALDIMIADASKQIMKEILITAKTNVQSGQPLSATFAHYSKHFPTIFVGLLKAGEASGHLDENMEELARQMAKDYALERKVKSAMTYPLILFFGSVAAVVLLLGFVLPKLATTFVQSGVKLPLLTRIFVQIGEIITFSWALDLFLVALVIYFFVHFRKTKLGKKIVAYILFKTPVLRELVKKSALVRLTRTLGSLLKSGMTINESLNLTAESVGNDRYKHAVLLAKKQVIGGVPFSKTFENFPELFPRFLTSLILVGEKTGTLENILKVFADFYEEELDTTLKDLSTYIEPILLLAMGLVIGAIAFSILLPIYQLVGQFT